MPNIWIYLVKANIALVLFYLGYRYGLRRLTFYTLNRGYLLVGIVVSATFPLINLRELLGSRRSIAVVPYTPDWNLVRSYVVAPASVSLWDVLTCVFWGGVTVMAIRFILQLLSIARIHLRSTDEIIFHQHVRRMEDHLNPFSFFGHIYVNPVLHPPDQLKNVIAHEQVHARGLHSIDILLAEIHKVFYWFNPGAWLMKRAVAENLEFITDRRILSLGVDRRRYQYSLLKAGCAAPGAAMVNHFNLSHLRKRIVMMNRARSTRVQLLRYLLLLPLIGAGALLTSARRGVESNTVLSAAPAAMALEWSGLPRPGAPADTTPLAPKPVPDERMTHADTQRILLTSRKSVRIVAPGEAPGARDSAPKPRYPGALYIVDGKLRDSAYMALQVPPEDISSISVVKGNAATAIYGSRGTAGVVVVRTKKAAVGTVGLALWQKPAPLYIVDHEIVGSSYVARYLKPGAILNMTMLKGKDAVDLFGAKGKNGVIMIESRAGRVSSGGPEAKVSGRLRSPALPPASRGVAAGSARDRMPETGYTPVNDNVPLYKRLLIVDGRIVDTGYLSRLKPGQIRSLTVLKDQHAVDRFGDKGKNGAIIIETKKDRDTTANKS